MSLKFDFLDPHFHYFYLELLSFDFFYLVYPNFKSKLHSPRLRDA